MHLRTLSLVNFKNYEQVEIFCSPKINCFVGENGVGKTNILDAVHYLALCKSNLNPVDTQNILYGRDFSIIQGVFERNGKEEKIYCGLRKQRKKQFKRNKKEYQKLAEHIGLIPLVMISPYDSVLINGGSEERRRFMNGVIVQYNNVYLDHLIQYNRALTQRNRLLKEFAQRNFYSADQLDIWDDQLIRYGEPVLEERRKFIDSLLPVFNTYYQRISGRKEEVILSYRTQLEEMGFREGLHASLDKDRILQYSSFGIHKDDLDMDLDDQALKKAGSQGQQKTFLVALKLAEFEFIRKLKNLPPILLLDDIFDKFDSYRVRQIIQLVAENHFGQIFITDTNETRLKSMLKEIPADHRIFLIQRNGSIETQE